MPFSAPGKLHVEAPRNFRVNVSMPITEAELLDAGSNDDEFWFWTKDATPQYLLTAHHADADLAMSHFRLPFEPNWVMEVMGVIPLDPNEYEMRRRPKGPLVELISIRSAPGGERVQKTLIVDTHQGRIIQHTLHGSDGRLIASASLGNYWRDPVSKLEVPRDVRLNFPEANLDITMQIHQPEINPDLPESIWQVPQKNGYKRLDMGQQVRLMQGNQGVTDAAQHAGRNVVDRNNRVQPLGVDYQLASPNAHGPSPEGRAFPAAPGTAHNLTPRSPQEIQPFEALDRVDQERSALAPLDPPGRATLGR